MATEAWLPYLERTFTLSMNCYGGRMRLSSRSVMALLLGLPSPAFAQAVTRADLLGVWVSTKTWNGPKGVAMTGKSYLVLRDDSTWTRVEKVNDGEKLRSTGRWMVSNDSLWLGDITATDTIYYAGSEYIGAQIVPKWRAQKVNLVDEAPRPAAEVAVVGEVASKRPIQKVDLSIRKLRLADYGEFTAWQESHQGRSAFPSIWSQEFARSTESEP